MGTRSFRPTKRRRAPAAADVDRVIREAKEAARARGLDYRARSLALHGWICARCAREFDEANLHLLTVHHKDGNHENNPPDGSNWENLCVDCHDAEHTTGLLGDYLTGKGPRKT
jgi:predicted HNH restriction endonuclease